MSAQLLDRNRSGSAAQQIAIGVLGFLLAAILIAGQVMVATTHGIARNVGVVNEHLETGNAVMLEIIAKSAPTPALKTAVDEQSATLAHTRDTLVLLNAELDRIRADAQALDRATGRMQQKSGAIGGQLGAMAGDVEAMSEGLSELPPLTRRIAGHLATLTGDSHAVNGEISAIAGKLQRYGLPEAQGTSR